MGNHCVQVWVISQETGVHVETGNPIGVYYGSKLLIGQVPWIGKDRSCIGMGGHYRPGGRLHDIPEAGIRQVGYIYQHAQLPHGFHKGSSLLRETPLLFLCIGA